MDQGLSGVAIAKQLQLPVSTVNSILKRLGRKVMKPIKEATEAQIKQEKAIEEIQKEVKGSIDRHKKCLEVLEGIRDRDPVKIKTKHGEITLDDAPLKLKASLAVIEAQRSLDELLGIRDIAVRKELEEIREIIRAEKRAKGTEERGAKPS